MASKIPLVCSLSKTTLKYCNSEKFLLVLATDDFWELIALIVPSLETRFFSSSIMPSLIASSTRVPATTKALKLGNDCANRCS